MLAVSISSGCIFSRPSPTPIPPTATATQRVAVASTPQSMNTPRPASPTATVPAATQSSVTRTPFPTASPTATRTPMPPALLPEGTTWELFGAESGIDEVIPVTFDPNKGPWDFTTGPTTGLVKFEVVTRANSPFLDLFPDANFIIKAIGEPVSTYYYYRVTQQEKGYFGAINDREGSLSKGYAPPEKIAEWPSSTGWNNSMSVLSGDQVVGEAVSEVKVMATGKLMVPKGVFDSTLLRVKTSEKTMGVARNRTEYRWLAKIDGKFVWAATIASRYNEKKDVFTEAQRFTRLKSLEIAR